DELLRRLLHQAAEQLAVQATPVDIAHIGLRTSDGELFSVDEGAANLDAAVCLVAGELHLALQLEIAEIALSAKECVVRNRLGAAADEKSLLQSPELGKPLPGLAEVRLGHKWHPAVARNGCLIRRAATHIGNPNAGIIAAYHGKQVAAKFFLAFLHQELVF